jgi:hypothetical protein
MTTDAFRYLNTQRAAEFIGDSAVLSVADGNTQGVNDLLHQFKGFAPVFCVDSLVELVVHVEALSKQASLEALQQAMAPLLIQLSALQAEVDHQLGA